MKLSSLLLLLLCLPACHTASTVSSLAPSVVMVPVVSLPKAKAVPAMPPLPPAPAPKSAKPKSVALNLASLHVQTITNGATVMVYIGTNITMMTTRLGSPMLPNATVHVPRVIAPGPHWSFFSFVQYFPPDPFAGNYFRAQADSIPPGTVSIEASALNGVWTALYTTAWTDPDASLGLTIDANLPSEGFRLKIQP